MKLLNKHNFAIATFTPKEQSRYTLNAILVNEQESVATDGHVLARVTLPTLPQAAQFPTFDGSSDGTGALPETLIPADACKAIEKSLPKKSNIPVLLNAAVSSDGKNTRIAITDLERKEVKDVRRPDGSYPDWHKVWNENELTIADITLDAKLLKRIADFALNFAGDSDKKLQPVRMRIFGEDSAMRFDMVNKDTLQECNIIAMPIRARESNKTHVVSSSWKDPQPGPTVKELQKRIAHLEGEVEYLRKVRDNLNKKPAASMAAD